MKKIVILILTLSSFFLVTAQNENVEMAHEAFKIAEYSKAKKYIEKAFKDTLQKQDPYATFIRARIFQKLYLDDINHPDANFYRAESLSSYILCKNTNTDAIRSNIVDDQLMYLANSYYDEAVTKLDTQHYFQALDAYDNFLIASKTIDTARNIKSNVIEFHTKLATVFEILYDRQPDREDILDLSKVSYLKILSEDDKNPKTNYLMSRLFLLEAKLSFNKNDSVKAKTVLSQGLGYAESAYYFAPKNIDIINTLTTYYVLLKETQKASDYQLIAEQVLKSGKSVKY